MKNRLAYFAAFALAAGACRLFFTSSHNNSRTLHVVFQPKAANVGRGYT
jgi:hypothetical protein